MTDLFVDALKVGDLAHVQVLLANDPSLADLKVGDVSAVMFAMYYGHAAIAAAIADFRADLTSFELTVLGDADRLEQALKGEDVNAYSADGFTALGFAAFFGRLEAAARLLELGANPNLPSQNSLRVAPLHSALAGGQSAIALVLLQGGADPDLQNAEGWTALHYCADIGDAEMAQLLMDRRADHTLRNQDGKTAAELAVDVGHDHVADVILEAVVAS